MITREEGEDLPAALSTLLVSGFGSFFTSTRDAAPPTSRLIGDLTECSNLDIKPDALPFALCVHFCSI